MKNILSILIVSTLGASALTIKENDRLIKENIVYLLSEVNTLKQKNNVLNKDILKLKKEINDLKQKKTYIKKEVKNNIPKRLKEITSHLYRVIYDNAPAYNNKQLKGNPKKIYKYMDIVRVIKKNGDIWQLDNLLWIDKKYLTPMNLKKEKFNYKLKISFYKINTYMANIRTVPNAKSKDDIARVLKKGDIIKVIDFVKNKDGGKWAKLDNGLYINSKIITPLF